MLKTSLLWAFAALCALSLEGRSMIANRFNPLGRNLGKTAKHYIQDGLLFHWDGIENAGYGKHDNNATVWKDLADNIDLTLTGETAWSDIAFQLNGAGSAIGAIDQSVALSVKTLEAVVHLSSAPSAIATIGGPSWNCMAFFAYGSTIEGASGVQYRRAINVPVLTPLHLARFRDSVSRKVLVNGVENATDNGNWVNSNDPANVSIGKNGDTIYCRGDIYAVRCYTRVLTIDEVNQNYAIDKERFGI